MAACWGVASAPVWRSPDGPQWEGRKHHPVFSTCRPWEQNWSLDHPPRSAAGGCPVPVLLNLPSPSAPNSGPRENRRRPKDEGRPGRGAAQSSIPGPLQGIGPRSCQAQKEPLPPHPLALLTPPLSHPSTIKEQDVGMTMLQNVLYKSDHGPVAGVLHTVVGARKPTPPQHRGYREGLRQYHGNRRERAAPGALRKSSRHLEVAPGSGPENRERTGGRLGAAVAGSQALSVGPSSSEQLHLTPSSGHVCRWGRVCGVLWGFSFPGPGQGGPGRSWGAVAVLPQKLLPKLKVRDGAFTVDRGGRAHLCGGAYVHTCACRLLSDSPTSVTSI